MEGREPLSIEQINESRIDSRYNIESFVLNIKAWENIKTELSELFKGGQKYKFDSNICEHLPNKKGIYIFYVEPDFPFLPETRYLMYVGRVIGTNTFHNRFYKYVEGIGNSNQSENKMLLTNMWPGKTWVMVYPLDMDDEAITKIEDNLIDNIVPPLNGKVKTNSAKNSRSIYQ